MKKLIIIFFMLIGWMSGSGQNYVQLGDHCGFILSTTESNNLETNATALIAALPEHFRSQFKVYEFSYYIYNEFMVGSNSIPAIWSAEIDKRNADAIFPYYLLIGKEIDHTTGKLKYRLKLHIPYDDCFNENFCQLNETAISENLLTSNISDQLTHLKNKILYKIGCCENTANCSLCDGYSNQDFFSYFKSKGFYELEGYSVSITTKNFQYLQSDIEIILNGPGGIDNITQQIENCLSNQGSGKGRGTKFNNSNCSQITAFNPLNTNGEIYIHELIVFEVNNETKIFSKLHLSDKLFESNFGDDRLNDGKRLVPVAVWIGVALREMARQGAKAASVGAANVLFAKLIDVLLVYWINGYWKNGPSGFNDAYKKSSLSWGVIASSFVSGALTYFVGTESLVKLIGVGVLTGILQYLVDTPYEQYTWEGIFTTTFVSTVLTLIFTGAGAVGGVIHQKILLHSDSLRGELGTSIYPLLLKVDWIKVKIVQYAWPKIQTVSTAANRIVASDIREFAMKYGLEFDDALNNMAKSIASGADAEAVAEQFFQKFGWNTLKYAYDQSADNGIDLILYRGTPPNIRDLVIVEVKKNLSSGGFEMLTGASYGYQMSTPWIRYCAEEFKRKANVQLLPLADNVLDLVLKGQYAKAGVSFRDQIVGTSITGNKELILINLAK